MTPETALLNARDIDPTITHIEFSQTWPKPRTNGRGYGEELQFWAHNPKRAYNSSESWEALLEEIKSEAGSAVAA